MMTCSWLFMFMPPNEAMGCCPSFWDSAPRASGHAEGHNWKSLRRAPNSAPKFADPIDRHRGPFEDQ